MLEREDDMFSKDQGKPVSNGDWTREVSPVRQLRRAEGNVETPDGTKPWFLQTIPSEMSVHVGDPLTLNCIIDGDPKPLGRSFLIFCLSLNILQTAHFWAKTGVV